MYSMDVEADTEIVFIVIDWTSGKTKNILASWVSIY